MLDDYEDHEANFQEYQRAVRGGAPSVVVEAIVKQGLWCKHPPETPPQCVRCGKHRLPWRCPWGGWFLPPLCDGCQAKADKAEAEALEEERKAASRMGATASAGIRAEELARLESIGLQLHPDLIDLDKSAQAPNWGAVMGGAGVGKTTYLLSTCVHLLRKGWRVRYTSAHDLAKSLKGSRDGGPSMVLQAYTSPELLALDACERRLPVWAYDFVEDVLVNRHRRGRPTLLGLGCQLDELQALGWSPSMLAKIRQRSGDGIPRRKPPRLIDLGGWL